MKQWAGNDGQLGVVCTCHRGSVLVSPNGLHHVRDLSSNDLENQWSRIEDSAMKVLDGFRDALGTTSDHLQDSQVYLSDPDRVRALIDFVALHHARSLAVPVQQWVNRHNNVGVSESEAVIRKRMTDVRDHYAQCGIQVSVYPEETRIPLGVIPVFEATDWGSRSPGTARFAMPLTPCSMIAGTPDLPTGTVGVIPGELSHEDLVQSQLAGEPGGTPSHYLICEPSRLQQTAETALRRSEGGSVHWFALNGRIALCGETAPREMRADWRERMTRCDRYRGLLEITSTPVKQRLIKTLAEDAATIQKDLDELNVSVCDCRNYRSNPETSTLWNAVMPQVICDAIRAQENVP